MTDNKPGAEAMQAMSDLVIGLAAGLGVSLAGDDAKASAAKVIAAGAPIIQAAIDKKIKALEAERDHWKLTAERNTAAGIEADQDRATAIAALEKYRHCRHGQPGCFCAREANAALALLTAG